MRPYARRKARPARRGLLIAVGCVTVIGLGTAGVVLGTSPQFTLQGARIVGPVPLAEAVLGAMPMGESLHGGKTRALSVHILGDLRIGAARIEKAGDGWLDIELTPRIAMVTVGLEDGSFGRADAEGLVFEARPEPVSAPLLQGPGLAGLGIGDHIDPATMAIAEKVVQAANEQGLPPFRQIYYGQDGRIAATLEGGTVVRFGRPESVGRKIAAVLGVLQSQDVADIEYVDVELLRHVVICPRGT